jgi:hypothetical protein
MDKIEEQLFYRRAYTKNQNRFDLFAFTLKAIRKKFKAYSVGGTFFWIKWKV